MLISDDDIEKRGVMDPAADMFYSWSSPATSGKDRDRQVALYDETLRDGLQSSSVRQPPLSHKKAILDAINGIGLEYA